MKNVYCLFVSMILCSSLFAQTKGVITGVVTDVNTKEPLPGATIVIEGTNYGTSTDLSGFYSLFVTAEKVTLIASFIGYIDQQVSVEVTSDADVVVDIQLKSNIQDLSEVLILSPVDGQAKALNQQRAADNIKNIVSADQMGRFPDQNSAETLQRVPGINVQRDQGDGRFVLVRGLAPQFTNINVNGEQIPSPDGEVRFVALDAVPADQLASLEVTKAITPDMDGDAIGGSVNLVTQMAKSEKLRITGMVNLNYSESSEASVPQGNLTISKRMADDKFGFIINGSYSGSNRDTERMEGDNWDNDNPDGVDEVAARYYEIERNRLGVSTTLDYKFNNKNKIYLRALYSELKELEVRRTLEFNSEDDGGLAFEMERALKHRRENQGIYNINLGGSNITPGLKIDYEVSFSQAFQKTPFDDQIFFENAEDVSWNVDISNPLIPNITNFMFEGNTASFRESSFYEFDVFESSETSAKDRNVTTKINLKLPFAKDKGVIQFGAKVRFKDKSFEVKSFEEYSYEGSETLLLSNFGFADGTNFHPFRGDFSSALGPFPDRNAVHDFFNANRSDFENDPAASEEEKVLEGYDASEDVYAAYIMGKIQWNKLMILGGLRYEATQFEYQSGQWDEENEVAEFLEGDNDYNFLLPMLHLKYSINDVTNLRAAATMSYARPNFVDLVQGATFDRGDNEAEIFNPDLTPVKAVNLDLFGEHYLGTVGILSAGVFYKKLDDFIYQQTTVRDFQGVADVEVQQSVNGDQAWLWGFELAYQQNLTFLPGVLSGLGVYINYTYTKSEADVVNFSQGQDLNNIDLPGQSDQIGNIALAYNKGGFNGRASINFNGSFISEFDGDDQVIIDDRTQIDISMSQTFYKRRLTAFLELVNITDEANVELFNTAATPKQNAQFGFWGRAGIRFSL